jgi:hypothetical protein
MFKPSLRLLFAALTVVSCPAVNAAALGTLTSIPETVKEGESFSLLFAGSNLPCGFSINRVDVLDDLITIEANQIDRVCPAVVLPFRVPVQVFQNGQTAKAGVYKVRLRFTSLGGGDQVIQQLLAFALIPVAKSGSAAVLPESGNWNFERGGKYATSGSGVSFNLERQGGTFAAMSNFYDSKGAPTWYFQAGAIANGVHQADAVYVTGGQALFGAYKPPAAVTPFANIAFEFHSPTQGTAWVSQSAGEGLTDGIKLMPISISRFNYGFGKVSEALQGSWVLAADQREGSGTQWLKFAPIDTASNVLSSYRDGEFRLNCTLEPTKPESLPRGCALLRGDTQVAALTQISYNKMRGVDPNGKALSLYRLD